MEAGIIHDYSGRRRKIRDKQMFKPIFKELAIHSPIVLKGRYNAFCHLSRYYAYTLIFFARYAPDDRFTFLGISMFSMYKSINTSFVNVGNFICGNITYFSEISTNLLRTLLLKAFYLFLRVIFRRFKVFEMVD